MKNLGYICFAGLLALFCGCKSYGPRFDARAPQAASTNTLFTQLPATNLLDSALLRAPTNFFRLGPGDVIQIESSEEASSSMLLVGPDGKVYYGLLPGVFVWGLTLNETKILLQKELSKFLRVPPDLVVSLKAVDSKRVWVLGSVQNPGLYSLATPMTLLETLAKAGGTLALSASSEEIVDLDKSFIIRQGRFLPVSFNALLRQGDLSQNIYVEPDDFIYLRPGKARDIYVLGALVAPNVFGYERDFSLLAAITKAGGPLPYAYLYHVAIIRGSLTSPKIAIVDYSAIRGGRQPDIRLEPGDIVYMPFAPYRKLFQFAEQVINQFVRTIALNEGQRAVNKNVENVRPFVGVGNGL